MKASSSCKPRSSCAAAVSASARLPYGDKLAGGFTDQQKEHGLRDQHRLVLDAIRDGRLDDILDKRETPETLAAVKELDVQWLNANSVHADRNLTMRLRVTESGAGVPGARLTVRFARPDAAPFYAQVVTDPAGDTEMKIEVDESSLPDSSVLVQASYSRPHRYPQVPAEKGQKRHRRVGGCPPSPGGQSSTMSSIAEATVVQRSTGQPRAAVSTVLLPPLRYLESGCDEDHHQRTGARFPRSHWPGCSSNSA